MTTSQSEQVKAGAPALAILFNN